MMVAINTGIKGAGLSPGLQLFSLELLKYIAVQHGDQRFLLISDRPISYELASRSNIVTTMANAVAGNFFLRKYWFDIKLPAILKKYRVGIFISPGEICSLTAKLPQCLITAWPGRFSKSKIKYYRKSKLVITFSGFSKKQITAHYNIPAEKVEVVFPAARSTFQPAAVELKENIKGKYSGGKDYFLFAGSISSVKKFTLLLKAFSHFKKRQQSSFKLLIAGLKITEAYSKILSTYKYRHDVVIINESEELEWSRIVASAYAVMYLFPGEDFFSLVPEVMQSGVPVISAADLSLPEQLSDAVLYADPNDPKNTGDKMIDLYTDENFRRDMIEKGLEITRKNNWQKTADHIWDSLLKACH